MRMRSFYFFNRDEIHKYKGFYMYPNIYITMKPIIELDIKTITLEKIK